MFEVHFALLLLPVCLSAPVEFDEFEFDFSYMGEEVYEQRSENQAEKQWGSSASDDLNPEETGSFAEGDIYQPLVMKNAVKFRSKKWKKAVIPFEISGDFTSAEAQKIRNAFQTFRHKTCVRFIPWVNQPDYISIESSSNGCWSTVGRTGGKQILNLQRSSCLRRAGTILHELMHVLGFFHEHTRYDRDRYVSINFQNIRPDATGNFKKERQDRRTTHGIVYDLGSVMHYSPAAFSWNGSPTIEAKIKFSGTIGQRNGFSSKDVQIINSLYCND